ncbi:MAG: (d)CMP kinase [Bacteroidales bacterium]|nr:(d)CMP kinase [Bacteroidales bacterium]
MKVPDIIIAVDGYSSTGKSTFAKLLASTFGLLYLDSGALYRAVTLFAQRNSLISADNVVSDALEAALASLESGFDSLGRTCLGEECVEAQIRSMEVSSQVSPIAAVPYVREYVDERLHLLASKGGVVMDGRDIGTTVFPDAQLKIFMTASDEVRARRRYDEMVAKGQSTTLEDVKKNLQQRDYIDSHRETSPLKRAEGSFLLDNSDMSMEEELQWARGLIQGLFRIYE